MLRQVAENIAHDFGMVYYILTFQENLPELGFNIVERILSKVDFPAPLGPINPINPPDLKFNDTSSNAVLFE